MKNFKGIFPALLTPFDADGKINVNALGRLIEMNLAKGVSGFYVGGSTSEAFLLTMEERMKLYDIAAQARGSCTLIAHTGCIATAHAIQLARHAESLGYDAVSAVPPFYYDFSMREIKRYYFDIASAVTIPVIIYNYPARSGVTLSVDDICEILDDERFIGVKHTSSDFFALERIKKAYPDKIVYSGYDQTFLAAFSMGADGGIGSTFNFMAEKFIRMSELMREGKIEEAQKIQSEVNFILTVLIKAGTLAGEKEILNQLGINFGNCRPPFSELTPEAKKLITENVMPYIEKI